MLARVSNSIRRWSLPKGYPLVFDPERSSGSIIHDAATSRKFIDMFSFYGSCPVGHNHPKMKAFAPRLGEMAIHNPANSNVYTEEYAKFVDTLGRQFPSEFKYMFLINGGALAVENALKAAFDWKTRLELEKGKSVSTNDLKIIGFREAFHGRSGYTMSLTNTDYWKTAFFPKFNWIKINNPKIIQDPQDLDDNYFGNLATRIAEQRALDHIRYTLKTNLVAAIIIEPIQGEGGDNHFRPEFWQALREIADQNDVMLIADEVQTGLGITGRTWAWQWLGASPDMIVFGKKTQVCGFVATGRMDMVKDHVFAKPGRMNSTWGGNLIDMMRSRKYMEIIEEERLIERAELVGLDALMLFKNIEHEKISNVRGRGLMIAFDLPDEASRDKFKDLMFEQGTIVLGCGTCSIRLRPMLDVPRETMITVAQQTQSVLRQI